MHDLYKGTVWKFGDNISTDLMMPGAQVLAKPDMSWEEAGKYCMSANRPGWAELVQPGDIIVAGRNFGCGSARPAPRVLRGLGIPLVVANSMSRLFFRNAINIGFPVLICPGVFEMFEEGQEMEVNLGTGQVHNLSSGARLRGEPLKPGSPPYEILQAGGLSALLEQRVSEARRLEGLRS